MAPLTGGTSTAGSSEPVSTASTSALRVVADAQAPVSLLRSMPGVLTLFSLSNNAPAARWARFYDSATLPDATSAPVWIGPFMLPAGDTFTPNLTTGIPFSKGLAIAISSGPGDTDMTPILDGDVIGIVGVR